MLTQERIDGAHAEREAAIAKGNRMCCHLEFNVLECTFRAEAEIYSQSGDTDTCSLHLFDMLEPSENQVYAIN